MGGERLVVSVHSREYEVTTLHLIVLYNCIVLQYTVAQEMVGTHSHLTPLPSPSLLSIYFYIFLYIYFRFIFDVWCQPKGVTYFKLNIFFLYILYTLQANCLMFGVRPKVFHIST